MNKAADKIKMNEKCKLVLNELLKVEDNKYCADCDSKGPRWASWNIGVFLCIRCAGIHRNLGVHISKVKSVNLDAWLPEQLVILERIGNRIARTVYEANLPRDFHRPQADGSLENFIREKYEIKRYMDKNWFIGDLPPKPLKWDSICESKKKKPHSNITLKTVSILSPILSSTAENLLCDTNKNAIPNKSELPEKTLNFSQDLLGFVQSEYSNSAPYISKKTHEISGITSNIKELDKTKLAIDSILALYGQSANAQTAPRLSNLTETDLTERKFTTMFSPFDTSSIQQISLNNNPFLVSNETGSRDISCHDFQSNTFMKTSVNPFLVLNQCNKTDSLMHHEVLTMKSISLPKVDTYPMQQNINDGLLNSTNSINKQNQISPEIQADSYVTSDLWF